MATTLEAESTLTDRCQTTVPETVRRALRLGKRDKIHYTIRPSGEVVLTRMPTGCFAVWSGQPPEGVVAPVPKVRLVLVHPVNQCSPCARFKAAATDRRRLSRVHSGVEPPRAAAASKCAST